MIASDWSVTPSRLHNLKCQQGGLARLHAGFVRTQRHRLCACALPQAAWWVDGPAQGLFLADAGPPWCVWLLGWLAPPSPTGCVARFSPWRETHSFYPPSISKQTQRAERRERAREKRESERDERDRESEKERSAKEGETKRDMQPECFLKE